MHAMARLHMSLIASQIGLFVSYSIPIMIINSRIGATFNNH